MLRDTETTMIGEVTDIFGHRFVIRTDQKKALADLGPEGMQQISLKVGDQVEISGEMKPSELKVARIVRAGEEPIVIRGPKHHHHGPDKHSENDADNARALAGLKDRGLTPVSSVRRKPKHVEILAKDTDDGLFEMHIELDGTIRKMKPVKAGEPKWAAERLR